MRKYAFTLNKTTAQVFRQKYKYLLSRLWLFWPKEMLFVLKFYFCIALLFVVPIFVTVSDVSSSVFAF